MGTGAVPGYGIPESKTGLLLWSQLTECMAKAQYYWMCTASLDGHPHAAPVDGSWLEDQLF
ncbi:MAG TPA: hypothetical protein VFL17_09775 [Anaerolineae bacterium]|nr:hypothetical protein [Anaerolineae bacterium]